MSPTTRVEPGKRSEPAGAGFDAERVRADFPILSTTVHGKPLVFLDSAATTQKPRAVIERVDRYYRSENANIHRGVYALSETSTREYEEARHKVRAFLNARDEHEIVFVRGTTEGLNLIASCVGRSRIRRGDEVVISHMEHHSNIVPWQMICEERGAKLRVIPMNDRGELLLDEYEKLLGPKTRVVSVVHQSNALGTVNPVGEMCKLAREAGALFVIDGAQSAAHGPIDVQEIDCDFYVISSHKIYGPTGAGAVYGRRELLEELPPYQGGGDMIRTVTFEKTTYAPPPAKFEAGTPNIVGAIAMGTAIDYLAGVDRAAVARHEADLLRLATDAVSSLPGVRVIGAAREKSSVLSFVLGDVHPHDVGTILDQDGVAVRTGHHCAQPVMQFFGVPATVRASFAMYNTREDVDALVRSLERVIQIFS